MSQPYTVIKRDGSEAAFSADKLNKWAEYATENGGNWSDIAISTFKRLNERCTTKEIHETMIDVCLSKETIEYSRVAARLESAEIRKGMQYVLGIDDTNSFEEIVENLEDIGLWDSSSIPAYNKRWEKWYDELKDLHFEYWQIKQWIDKYALRYENVVLETPQIGFLGIALAIYGDRVKAFEFAKSLCLGEINLPTPVLNGCRNGDFDSISCCLISGGDSTESIGVADHIAYRMTAKKAGIGIELTTRSKGDPVKQGRVKHLGKWPLYKMIDRSVKAMCYDTKTEVLTNNGFKLFSELESDDLVAQVNHDRTLSFVKPTEYVALPYKGPMYHFNKSGVDIRVTDNHQMANRKISYDDKSKQTSKGYEFQRADKFECKRTVAWDFGGKLNGKYNKLSDLDRLRIALHADGSIRENKTTPNSYDFSFLKDRKIERFKNIMENLGVEYHAEKNRTPGYSLNLRESEWGLYTDFILKQFNHNLEKNLDWVYQRDWGYSAAIEFFEELRNWDGDYRTSGDQLCCFNTKNKKDADAVQFVASISGKRSSLKFYNGCYRVCVFNSEEITAEATKVEVEDYDDYVFCVTVPTHILVVRRNGYTNVCGNTQITRGGNATMTALAIDPEIEDILMWRSQRTDIEQRIDKLDFEFGYNDALVQAVINDEDWHLFGLKDAPEIYEKFYTASADEYNKLVENYIQTGGKVAKTIKARDLLKTFLTVRQETGRFYDNNLTRTNAHTPFLDLIRQSNLCMEIGLPTKAYPTMYDLYSPKSVGETAFCSLAAINVMKTAPKKYEKVAMLALEAVDKLIDLAPMMTESMKESIMKRRSIGIGIIGLAGALYQEGYDYDGTKQSLDFVQGIAERHYFSLLKASQKLAEKDNYKIEGVDLEWLPIDTAVNEPVLDLDWESLRGNQRKHSVLVAHMPTESSSLLSGAPNGLYPVRKKVINKRSRKGLVQFICEVFDPEKHMTAWDVDNIALSRYYGRVQDFTDQGISCDFYVVPSKYDGGKVPMSQLIREWVAHAKFGNKTKYYLNTNDENGGSIQDKLKRESQNKVKDSETEIIKNLKTSHHTLDIEDEEDGCDSCKL